MIDHSGLRYLFDQQNLNAKESRWLAIIREFSFEIRYIKGKENSVENALNRRVQVNNISTMSSNGIDLQELIFQVRQQDDSYQQLKKRLQQQGEGDRDEEYHLTIDGLVKFMNNIYVLDNSELKKLILMEFHVKPYSCHLGYQNTLTVLKKLYY